MRTQQSTAVLILILMTGFATSAMLPTAAQDPPSVTVITSIAPLAAVVSEVGGVAVEVSELLPEGIEPHSFSATPQMVSDAESADLLVLTGHFPWEDQIISQVTTPYISLHDYELYGASLSPLPGLDDVHNDQGTEDGHGDEGNPHGYWLLPMNAVAIANATRVALTAIESSLVDQFELGFRSFTDRIDGLLNYVAELDEGYRFTDMSAIVVFPAEAYIAEAFGIEVRGVIQKGDNLFVSAGELLEIQRGLQNGSITLILGSDVGNLQTAGEIAEQLALDSGAHLVWWKSVFSGSIDYVSLLSYNLGMLVSGIAGMDAASGNQTLVMILAAISTLFGLLAVGEAVMLVRRARSA